MGQIFCIDNGSDLADLARRSASCSHALAALLPFARRISLTTGSAAQQDLFTLRGDKYDILPLTSLPESIQFTNMSGLEVLEGISVLIAIIDGSVKV